MFANVSYAFSASTSRREAVVLLGERTVALYVPPSHSGIVILGPAVAQDLPRDLVWVVTRARPCINIKRWLPDVWAFMAKRISNTEYQYVSNVVCPGRAMGHWWGMGHVLHPDPAMANHLEKVKMQHWCVLVPGVNRLSAQEPKWEKLVRWLAVSNLPFWGWTLCSLHLHPDIVC